SSCRHHEPSRPLCNIRRWPKGAVLADRISRDKLVTDWVRVSDETQRKQLATEVQKVALTEAHTCHGENGFSRRPVRGVQMTGRWPKLASSADDITILDLGPHLLHRRID